MALLEWVIPGPIYTGTLIQMPIPDELVGLDIKEVRLSSTAVPVGQATKVDVRKSGTATTDSIFTGDVEIQMATTESVTNLVYQSGCNTVGSTVGTAGTTIDSARDTLAADDVLYIVVTQTGSTTVATDLLVQITVAA